MTVNLKLLTSEPRRHDGYPLVYVVSHNGVKLKFRIGYALPYPFSICLIATHPSGVMPIISVATPSV
jgi:hypothetical protein